MEEVKYVPEKVQCHRCMEKKDASEPRYMVTVRYWDGRIDALERNLEFCTDCFGVVNEAFKGEGG